MLCDKPSIVHHGFKGIHGFKRKSDVRKEEKNVSMSDLTSSVSFDSARDEQIGVDL